MYLIQTQLVLALSGIGYKYHNSGNQTPLDCTEEYQQKFSPDPAYNRNFSEKSHLLVNSSPPVRSWL